MPEQSNAGQHAIGSNIAQADRGSTAIVVSYDYAPPRPVDDAATLEAARRSLAELPLEEVPKYPAALPPGSRIPLSQNPLFVGREEQLKALAKSFKGEDNALEGRVITVASTGIGGVGKSQLASEFVHRYGQYFTGGVFWLSFADASTIATEIAACGVAGGAELGSDFIALSIPERALRVMSAWQSELPRLLVFDNCEEQELLKQWRPPAGACRVLVTSRREQWSPQLGVTPLRLDVLSREESITLLRKHCPGLPSAEDPNLDAIGQQLGDLPLALELAGNFLREYRFARTPAAYLEELCRPNLLQHISLKEGGPSLTDHGQSVARSFALSYERLNTSDPTDALAVKLLARAACLAVGEPMSRSLLKATLDLPEDEVDTALRAEKALRKLEDLGLLQSQETGELTLHRLMAAFVRDVVVDEEALAAAEMVLLEAAGPLIKAGNPEPLVTLLPHLRAVTDAAKEREDERAVSLCDLLGICLYITGAYTEARPYLERALAIYRKVYAEDHPLTARTLNNLAALVRAQGYYQEARPLYERALAICEKLLGEEHPYTNLVRQNLTTLDTQQR
jgi:tetratricopeptide (TPR) repeat protein